MLRPIFGSTLRGSLLREVTLFYFFASAVFRRCIAETRFDDGAARLRVELAVVRVEAKIFNALYLFVPMVYAFEDPFVGPIINDWYSLAKMRVMIRHNYFTLRFRGHRKRQGTIVLFHSHCT